MLQRYILVTYINRCDCGNEQHYDVLMALYQRSHNSFYTIDVKPGSPIFDVGEINRETRTTHTRVCTSCITSIALEPYVEKKQITKTLRAVDPTKISISDLKEFL
jgi:hypothetical protein